MVPRGSYAGLKVEHTKTVFFHHVPTACGRCAGRGHACVISTASALHIAVATSNIIVFPSRRHHRRPPSPRRRTGTYTRCKCTLFSPSKTPPLSCPSLLFRHSRQGRAPLPAYSRGATRPRNDPAEPRQIHEHIDCSYRNRDTTALGWVWCSTKICSTGVGSEDLGNDTRKPTRTREHATH